MTRLLIATVLLALTAQAEDLTQRLAKAKPGQTITLPAGEFRGGATLPAGVKLKGAGFGKTIIDAGGAENGISITTGEVSDLTVRGAAGANILVNGAATVRRVRVTGGLIGVSVKDARGARVESVVSDANRYGIVMTGGEGNVIVNCTVAGNASVGMSLASGKNAVVFNNIVTDSAMGVVIGEQAEGLTLDHNLYLSQFIGKFHSQIGRSTLNDWRFLSKLDTHSVDFPVKFDENFAATNVLDWAQDRTVTTGWGAKKLAGQTAPGDYLGAVESKATAPRPPDGTLTVAAGIGVISAGVFDGKNKLVAYLFQGLPLRPGKYPFWLPARSYKGRVIEAGEYEVRQVESKLDWEYLGWIANTSDSDVLGSSCATAPVLVVFDNAGRLIAGRGESEARDQIRWFDGATGKGLWQHQGSAEMLGLVVAEDGLLYVLRDGIHETRLTRLNPATGKIAPWGKTDYGQFVLKGIPKFNGMAVLGDRLFYADPSNNVVRVASTQSPEPTTSIAVKSPSHLVADAKAKIIWAISAGEKLVAFSADGKIVAETQPVPQPVALAARDGRLAVASKQTGKVHIFDASDPAKLKELSTVGRGDGPDGRVLPDRFIFQEGASEACLAFGPNQELAVGEHEGRLQVFDRDGKLKWTAFSTGGWGITASRVTPGRAFAGGFTMLTDSEQKKWWPESFHRAMYGWVIGEFQVEGKTFMALCDPRNGVSFVKFTPDKAEPAIGIICPWASREPWTYRVDSNHDFHINSKDAVVANVLDANGKPVSGRRIVNEMYNTIWPNGDLTSIGEGWLVRWPCAGLDKDGNPIYRFQDRMILSNKNSDIVSPYSLKPEGGGSLEHYPRPNGGWMTLTGFPNAPSARHTLTGGTSDVIGVDKNGVVDWVHVFGLYPGNSRVASLDMEDGIYLVALSTTYDFFALNEDGLTLQGCSLPERAHYLGHWVDHPDTVTLFKDKQGKINVLTSEYMSNRNQWLRLQNKDIRATKTKLTVSPATAGRLAALPVPHLDVAGSSVATATVRIPHLKAPLPIDGDLQKWRDAGVTPQIICTPDSSSGIEGGPRDASAVVRLAWHGKDLYLQALCFDDIIALHQPCQRAYLQDTLEMAINGTMEGIKHNISLTTDAGPVNQVDAWDVKAHILDQKDSPLVVKVLDSAEAVTERQLIENIYGVSLRDCKVRLYETRIPMNEKTYAGKTKAMFELKPGAQFWLGFLIDDNDQPGTDLQNYLIWPNTYGTVSAKESGALATLGE